MYVKKKYVVREVQMLQCMKATDTFNVFDPLFWQIAKDRIQAHG